MEVVDFEGAGRALDALEFNGDVREPLEFIKATSPEAFGHAGGCGAHCIGCCLRADVCKML